MERGRQGRSEGGEKEWGEEIEREKREGGRAIEKQKKAIDENQGQ